MKTENELIAEFMGHKPDHRGLWPHPAGMTFDFSPNPLYNTSWDWLMPVVDKIESIYKQGKLFQCPQYQRIRGVKITDVTITELHALIVDFIRWFNSQNS